MVEVDVSQFVDFSMPVGLQDRDYTTQLYTIRRASTTEIYGCL